MGVVLALLIATACSGGDGFSSPAATTGAAQPTRPLEGEVVSVEDGDTFDVLLGGAGETVRLIGINSPEDGECFSDEARAALVDLVLGEPVELLADTSDRDQYGRLLRYVSVDGTSVNQQLVADGMARSRAYPPDTAQQAALDAAEEMARAQGVGLWADDACGAAPTPGESDIAIVAAVADPSGSDEADPNGETVTIANRGTAGVDLSGWVLKDTSASHRFTFPGWFVLPPSAEVVVHTGCGTDTATDLYWCNPGSLVWNNGGDTAYLEDPAGNTISVLEV
jgi:micrococcal nuclease